MELTERAAGSSPRGLRLFFIFLAYVIIEIVSDPSHCFLRSQDKKTDHRARQRHYTHQERSEDELTRNALNSYFKFPRRF